MLLAGKHKSLSLFFFTAAQLGEKRSTFYVNVPSPYSVEADLIAWFSVA
jgi:hypothetical protein